MEEKLTVSHSHRFIYLGYLSPLLFLGIILYVWQITNPTSIGPAGILGVFLLLYLFWTSLFFVIVHIMMTFLHRLPVLRHISKTSKSAKARSYVAYYTASILAFAPVLILAMQSVDQLTWRDITLVVVFVGLAIFYVLKRIR